MNSQSIKQTEQLLRSNQKSFTKKKVLTFLEAVTEHKYPCQSKKELEDYIKGYEDVVTFVKNGTVAWRTTQTTQTTQITQTTSKVWTDYQEGVVAAVNQSYGNL